MIRGIRQPRGLRSALARGLWLVLAMTTVITAMRILTV